MIVEYVDWNPGSGWAIKVYNPSGSVKNLSNYYVQVYNNNNSSASGSQQLSGSLNPGASIIISNANNTQAGAAFQACNDDISTNLVGVNDDDCIALTLGNSTNFVDMIGLYGVAVKNQVSGTNNALKWQKLVRDNGNCTRYTSTDGSSPNSWPSSSSVSLNGWTVLSPACLSTGNNYSPFGTSQVLNESICAGDSFFFNEQYLSQAGTYFDTTYPANGCGQISRLNLSISQAPSDRRSYEICATDSLELYGNWYREDTVFTLKRTNPGACDSLIDIEVKLLAPEANPAWNYSSLDSTQILFQSNTFGNIVEQIWYFGDGDSSLSSQVQHGYEPGTYEVKLWLMDLSGCTATYSFPVFIPDQSFVEPIIPNVFTPNGDFLNDHYYLDIDRAPLDFEVRIVDRYGLLVFESRDPQFRWNGSYKGEALGSGTYFIEVHWDGRILKKFLSLQR